MSELTQLRCNIPEDHAGWRLDRSLASLFPEYSRARIQTWISNHLVTVNGDVFPSKHIVRGGENVVLSPVQENLNASCEPENIALDVIFEDEHLLVINKPAGLVVHPGAGNRSGTLMNALLYYDQQFASLPRAGIVHRLDKDTSGLMVIAKSTPAHTALVEKMQNREIERNYYAIVRGQLISGGTINEPIGRHPHDRTKMAVSLRGKAAVTHYRIMEKFKNHTWLSVKLETGRTHQIRVHLAALKHPLIGDLTYGQGVQKVANVASELNDCLTTFPRQALHSFRLAFSHPITQQNLEWKTALPIDFEQLLDTLRKYSAL